jgi:hypothetical protein
LCVANCRAFKAACFGLKRKSSGIENRTAEESASCCGVNLALGSFEFSEYSVCLRAFDVLPKTARALAARLAVGSRFQPPDRSG